MGVEDDGTPIGINPNMVKDMKKNFVNQLNNPDKMSPTLYLSIEDIVYEGMTLLWVYVPPTSTVEKCANRIYDRNEDGDMDITDSPIQLQNMYNRKSNTYAEHKIFPYVTTEDLRMGTNFYLMSRNKKLMREHFAVETEYDIKDIEYAIVDEPYLGYEIHLNKLSWGWRPLFQRHKTIKTFKELEEFCLKNKSVISIYDEYGRRYTWKQYFERVYEHSQQKKEPRKWIYDIDSVFPNCGPRLQNVSCTEQEAEIYIPFCHREYNEKEKLAKERFHVHERLWCKERYWEDPDYPFDWTEGEFC